MLARLRARHASRFGYGVVPDPGCFPAATRMWMPRFCVLVLLLHTLLGWLTPSRRSPGMEIGSPASS